MENNNETLNQATQLEMLIKATKDDLQTKQNELSRFEQELEDINKPTIEQENLEMIIDVMHKVVDQFMSNICTDDVDVELEMDYDNTVRISNISISRYDTLQEELEEETKNLFKIIEKTFE